MSTASGRFTKKVLWIGSPEKKILMSFVFRKPRPPKTSCPKDLLYPNWYASYWSSVSRKGYSGVAAYSKIPVLDVKHGMDLPEFDGEGRFLQLDFGGIYIAERLFSEWKDEILKG